MRTKAKTAPGMRVVSLLLILASAAMLLMPWMELSLTYGAEVYSGGQILDLVAAQQGADRQQLMAELRGSMEELEQEAAGTEVRLDGESLYSLAAVALRCAWSPASACRLLGGLRDVLTQFAPFLQMDALEPDGASLSRVDSVIGTAWIGLLILVLLTVAAAILAAACAAAGHRGGMIPYLVLVLMLLVVFLAAVIGGKERINELNIAGSFGLELPGNALSLRVGFGGFVCLALAVLAHAAMCVSAGKRESAAPAAIPVPAAPVGWRCPFCGSLCRAEQRVCLTCGEKRPESVPTRETDPAGWNCPNCDAKMKAWQKFCSRCGAKRPDTAPEGWDCPTCGAVLRSGLRYCPRCGTKRPDKAAVTRPRACALCGRALEADMAFCPRCGSPVQAARGRQPVGGGQVKI